MMFIGRVPNVIHNKRYRFYVPYIILERYRVRNGIVVFDMEPLNMVKG